ncbi:MAG TPA: gamma-glutamylcyclotransferase family protein [Baekduia sp.]|nr:gamma-glutamylcyclotransferase family protein [Baekduia sp.]
MDNTVELPGYKVYALPDGTRPALAVAFLDLEHADGATVEGTLSAVDATELAALDARERQYERVDVTALVDPAPGGPVWIYVGRAPGRARVAAGRAGSPRIAIQRAYVELVEAAFAALGDDALSRYRATTEAPPFPVLDLTRIDLPGQAELPRIGPTGAALCGSVTHVPRHARGLWR